MGISSFESSRTWQDYKSTSYKGNVSSLKTNIKEDFSNDFDKFKTILKDTTTAFVDLGNDISEQAKTNWKTLTSTFTAVGATLGEQVNELETGAKKLVSKFNSALSNLNKKTYELGLKIEDKLFEAGEWIQDKENWKKVGATIVVGGASVLTGIGDLGEKLVDGLTWCGGKLVEGGSFVVAKIQAKTGHEEAAQKTMDWRETMKTDVAGFISHDYVKEFEKYLFEDTKAGQAINAASWLKYDSKVAQGISNVTEKVAEFAAATAITIATGGVGFPAFAAVFGVGFVAGVGGSAEKNYAKAKAEGKTPSIDDKFFNILIDGLGSGFNWYAQGQMGKGISEALTAISKVGAKTFGSTLVSGLKDSIANLKGKSSKEVMSFLFSKSNLKSSLFSADNLTDSGGVVADNIASWLNGDEEFNLKNVLGAGAELLGTSLINIVTGGIIDHAGKIDDAAEGAENILKNSDDIIDSADDIPKSADDIKKLQQEYDDLVAYTNSEKGGFDAVYGRFSANGAAKIKYDESVARIKEIEDILRNTDNISSTAKNADDVIEILDDITDSSTDVNKIAKNVNPQDNNIKIAEQILDHNSEQSLLEASKHLDDKDIKEVLSCLSPEEIARELETANKFEYVDIMKKLSYDDKINVIYEQAKLAANGEYNAFFINFREHAALHTNNVRDYAVDFAKNLEGVDLKEVYYGAQFHDFGMKNSGVFWDKGTGKYLSISDVTKDDLSFKELKEYIADSNGILEGDLQKFILDNYGIDIKIEGVSVGSFPDDIIDEAFSNKIADLARGNHPVNSAVTVLTTDITPEGVDAATVALLAMSHSKSTSGIQDFSNVEQWKNCVEKLGKALEADGTMSAKEIADVTKKLNELIGDGSGPEFKRVVNEAIAIRDGDAMSALALTSSGDTIMQTGNYSHVEYTGKAKLSADYSEVPSSQKEEIDGIVDIIHDANDSSKTTEVKNRFSKKTHAGELNVKFDSDYDGDVYYSISKVSDPTSAPYSTLDSIFERAGEVATYGNCSDRIFEIELPKAMENTALGNWYKNEVNNQAAKAITKANAKGTSSYQLESFYNNCIKVVFR